jgi:hypothetical protein
MTRKRKRRKPVAPRPGGPIAPGSPLHRLLERVAEEVARDLAQRPRPGRRRRPAD